MDGVRALQDRILPFDETALFLDLDGTLAQIAPRPEDVAMSPAALGLLRRLRDRLGGRLAILSGRDIPSIDAILPEVTPSVAGVHGLRRRTAAGEMHGGATDPRIAEAEGALTALARAQPGLLVEPKGLSVAIHYRQAPSAREAVLEAVNRMAEASGLAVQHGKAVVELKTPGADKATALRHFMSEPPFEGAAPLFIGDDDTDEPALREAAVLGGAGVLVGPPRASEARYRLAEPAAVLAWLERSLERGEFDLGEAPWAG